MNVNITNHGYNERFGPREFVITEFVCTLTVEGLNFIIVVESFRNCLALFKVLPFQFPALIYFWSMLVRSVIKINQRKKLPHTTYPYKRRARSSC